MGLSKQSTTVRFEYTIQPLMIKPKAYLQSTVFGTNQTKLYLRLHKFASTYFTLHLQESNETRLSLSLKVKYKTNKTDAWFKYEANGAVSLHKETKIDHIFPSEHTFTTLWEFSFEESQMNQSTNHQEQLVKQMASLREDLATFTDITLITTQDNRRFSVHKLVLAMRSPVFAAMFTHKELSENQRNLVEIPDVKGEVMESLLKYVYSGDISGVEPVAEELLEVADKYDIPLLVQECLSSMMRKMNEENAASFFYLADLHHLLDYKKTIARFICQNKVKVRHSPGWKEFIRPNASLIEQLFDCA